MSSTAPSASELSAPELPTGTESPSLWRRLGEAFLRPISRERREVNARRRASIPERLQDRRQVLGLGHHSCGATHSVMERCDFACTSCYLSAQANATPPLAESEVFGQLDALREFLGPQGKAQITSGEVTLLPREVLGRYVRYARQIGLDPMVMSHGERLLRDPSYLVHLVLEAGLEKLSIHVDVTQRGREGWQPGLREADLHPVRERYANLVREVRRETGATLHVAQTVTVTEDSVADVPEVMRWVADNADAFRMISFQPVAAVGRTQDRRAPLELDDVWERICEGLGADLNRHAMHFGHPECNILAPVVLARVGSARTVFETAREGRRWDRGFLSRLMGALGGFSTRGKSRLETAMGFLSLCLRNPLLGLEAPAYGLYRLWGARSWLMAALSERLRGRRLALRPLAIVVHRFMSPDELDTELGRERLAACTFQVPVDGRMAPMCELNATSLRAELNARAREAKAAARA